MKRLKKAVSGFINVRCFKKRYTTTDHFGDVLGITRYTNPLADGTAEIMVQTMRMESNVFFIF